MAVLALESPSPAVVADGFPLDIAIFQFFFRNLYTRSEFFRGVGDSAKPPSALVAIYVYVGNDGFYLAKVWIIAINSGVFNNGHSEYSVTKILYVNCAYE